MPDEQQGTVDRTRLRSGRARDIKADSGSAVRLVQLGKAIQSFRVPVGGTVEQALALGDIADRGTTDIRVNGKKIALSTELQEGDLITVVPFIRGGRAGTVEMDLYIDYT